MNISIENKQVIKVLNALIGGRVKVGLEKFPVAIIHDDHLISENIGTNEGMEILNQLFFKNYIAILSDKEFKEYEKEFEKVMNWLFRFLRKRRGVSQKDIEKAVKKMLWNFGFDVESDDFFDTNNMHDLKDYKRKVSNTVLERQVKSPEIGKYRVTKNLFLLREKLRRGRDFYNMTKEFIEYDSEKYDLYIGEEYTNIRPMEDIPAGHFILKYILENGSKETYNLDELVDMDIIPIYYHMKTMKQYGDSARGITRKINKQTETRIPDFFKVNKGTIKIRDKYTL